MPERFFGPDAAGAGPFPTATGLILSGLSLLPWLIALTLLAVVALRSWSQQRQAPQPEPAFELPATSAVELLRLRYVLGEIDAVTFEEMLERVLASEVRAPDPARGSYPGAIFGEGEQPRRWTSV